jgi:hypothetical protein
MLHFVSRDTQRAWTSESAPVPFGARLKAFFDDAIDAAVPDRLAALAQALEDALENGDGGLCRNGGLAHKAQREA